MNWTTTVTPPPALEVTFIDPSAEERPKYRIGRRVYEVQPEKTENTRETNENPEQHGKKAPETHLPGITTA